MYRARCIAFQQGTRGARESATVQPFRQGHAAQISKNESPQILRNEAIRSAIPILYPTDYTIQIMLQYCHVRKNSYPKQD
mgnify:CR=1 FL=1